MHPATRRRNASRLVVEMPAAMALAVTARGMASPTPTPVPSSYIKGS
jgi:hypothetical protein